MGQIIEFDLSNGGRVAVETQGSERPGPAMRGSTAGTVAKAARSFEDAVGVIQPVASALIAKLKDLEQGAEAIDIKFGLKFNAEAGVVIASASTEANIEIRINWQRKPASP